MKSCCIEEVPHPDSSFETFARPVADWTVRLTAGLARSVRASDQTLGDMEEEILRQTQGLEYKLLEEAAQKRPIRVRRFVRYVGTSSAAALMAINALTIPDSGQSRFDG